MMKRKNSAYIVTEERHTDMCVSLSFVPVKAFTLKKISIQIIFYNITQFIKKRNDSYCNEYAKS